MLGTNFNLYSGFFFPCINPMISGGSMIFWIWDLTSKNHCPPEIIGFIHGKKKPLYKLNLIPKIIFYMVLMDIGKYSKPCIRASQEKKTAVHKLMNSGQSGPWGRKPCIRTKEFRPQRALGTKTMYESRANQGIPRMGGKNPVSWCQKICGCMIYANKMLSWISW